mgnify:CR=1 FL=1
MSDVSIRQYNTRQAITQQTTTVRYNAERAQELRTEMVRKSIHMLVGLVPFVASIISPYATMILLGIAAMVYTAAERSRLLGHRIAVISRITAMSARRRDQGSFVMGPVTLALGAMASLYLYPEPAATIAIFALAFGDGLASLVGKFIGRYRIPFTGGKTIEGSLACFLGVFASSYTVTRDASQSTVIATVATLVELLPSRDADNMLLPILTGLTAVSVMQLG